MPPGKNRQLLILGGAAIVVLLILGLGSVAAYGILFPPVWTERLPFLNSTGQYDVITVYRNATDHPYANLTAFLDDVSPGLQDAIAADARYRCVEYAVVLHDRAEERGINCTIVGEGMSEGGSVPAGRIPKNALVAFFTTDRGMACVDPTAMNVSAADYPGIDFTSLILARTAWNSTPESLNAAGMSPPTAERRDADAVTYTELTTFLASDHTEDRAYVYPNYTCLDFAVDLHNRAEAAGLKCGVVAVGFEGREEGHAFDAFPTTDRGTVFVDCTGINLTEKQDGAAATDNIVYLQNGSELGELPLTQVDGRLDYAFYLDRKDRIDAYRQLWKQYAADVSSYNADVVRHDARLAANDQYYAAYSRECEEFAAALKAYNDQMTLHNQAIIFNNNNPYSVMDVPDAPSNRAELEEWQAKLNAKYDQYKSTWDQLEAWRQQLNMQKSALDGRLNALRNAEESKWITFNPLGIVEDIDIYWG
jgi:hypothetical protein